MAAEADAERQQPLADTLSSLANPVRLAILNLLQEPRVLKDIRIKRPTSDGRRRVLARQTVREHLDRLAEEDLVRSRETERSYGNTREYVLDHRRLFEISETIRQLARRRPQAELGGPTLGGVHAAHSEIPEGPVLVLAGGLERGRVFELGASSQERWVVGRRRDADISLDYDPFVSADNAEVRLEEGRFHVRDLPESRNGTRLNFQKLEPGGAKPLQCGDTIGVGRSLLLFRNR